MKTFGQTLAWAQSLGLDRLDAQLLLLHALDQSPQSRGRQRAWLLAHGDDQPDAGTRARFEHLSQRRLEGEPVAYIVGHREFFGLDLEVDRRVLIPRPDTETLVEWTLELLLDTDSAQSVRPRRVLDLGTGSGAIALALKHSQPAWQVDAVDASAAALEVARANALRLRLSIDFKLGSWLDPVAQPYHCIVSNPPYVAADDPHLAALAHEPRQALVSGVDGLDDLRHIVVAARARLEPGGWLLLEHGCDQAGAVRALLADARYIEVQSRRDLAGHERCSGGRTAGVLP